MEAVLHGRTGKVVGAIPALSMRHIGMETGRRIDCCIYCKCIQGMTCSRTCKMAGFCVVLTPVVPQNCVDLSHTPLSTQHLQ